MPPRLTRMLWVSSHPESCSKCNPGCWGFSIGRSERPSPLTGRARRACRHWHPIRTPIHARRAHRERRGPSGPAEFCKSGRLGTEPRPALDNLLRRRTYSTSTVIRPPNYVTGQPGIAHRLRRYDARRWDGDCRGQHARYGELRP